MTGVNKAIVVGNLGADPKITTTQAGRKVATLSIATGEAWRDKATGDRKERTDWHRVVIYSEPLVEIAEKYLKKGAKVYVEGKMQTRDWTDQAGVKRYVTEIVLQAFNSALTMLDRAGGGVPAPDDDDRAQDSARPGVAARGAAPRSGPGSDMDDDIPF